MIDSKRTILEMLEQGKISQEEANQLLAAMEDDNTEEQPPEEEAPQEETKPLVVVHDGDSTLEVSHQGTIRLTDGNDTITVNGNAGTIVLDSPTPPTPPTPPAPPTPPTPPTSPALPTPPTPPTPPTSPSGSDPEELAEYAREVEEAQAEYQSAMAEYRQEVEELQREYQAEMEEYSREVEELQAKYRQEVEELQAEYQRELEKYQRHVKEYEEQMPGEIPQPREARCDSSRPSYWPLTDEEYNNAYNQAYNQVYNEAYNKLYEKFGPGTEGFDEEVEKIAAQALDAANEAVEKAKAEKRQAPPQQPSQRSGGWRAWLNQIGQEINQAMSGIGEEIGIDLNEAMEDVADAVSDLKESLRDMVDDWKEQKAEEEEDEDEDFGDNFPFDDEDDSEDSGTAVSSSYERVGGEYVYTSAVGMRQIEKLSVNWFNGQVQITPWDGDYVEVSEHCSAPLDPDQRMYLMVTDAEKLSIEWSKKKMGWNMFGHKTKSLTVRIPRELAGNMEKLRVSALSASVFVAEMSGEDFDVGSTSGTVRAENLHSEAMYLHSVSGSLSVENVSAERLKLNTVSGKLSAEDFSAEAAELSVVSGSLQAHGNAEKFQVNTTSGSATLTVDQCPEKAKMHSISGRLRLVLPENKGFTVQYGSTSGGFHSEFPVAVSNSGKKSGKAVYGNGETRVEMNTTSGSMEIKRA